MKNSLYGLLLAALPAFSSQQLTVVGDAYDMAGEQLLYQEYHYYSADNLDHKVVYKDAEQQDIAVKTVDYRSGTTTPAFRQQSWNYPEDITVELIDGQLLIRYAVGDEAVRQERLDPKQPLVIDAGFDYYVRNNWAALTRDEALSFFFPAVTRQSLIKLKIKQTACSYATETDVCFVINSANWLISLLLDPIELGYGKNSRQLNRFRGLANLTDSRGEGLKVDIRYTYQPR